MSVTETISEERTEQLEGRVVALEQTVRGLSEKVATLTGKAVYPTVPTVHLHPGSTEQRLKALHSVVGMYWDMTLEQRKRFDEAVKREGH